MNQVLTQSEVDALLNAVAEGSVDIATRSRRRRAGAGGGGRRRRRRRCGLAAMSAAADAEVTPYDLTNQDRVIRGRMPTLDIIYERFIRFIACRCRTRLRKIATISIISTDLLKFGEFVNTLPIPSCMCIMRFESLRGPALLVFESKLAYALVDSFFGGTDRPYTKIEGKEFTRIELSIMKKVMDLALHDLEEAWAPVHKTDISYVRTEVNPQFVGVVPPSDVIISTTFEVELENASGTIALVIPYSTIEPIKNKLNASFQTETDRADKEWTEQDGRASARRRGQRARQSGRGHDHGGRSRQPQRRRHHPACAGCGRRARRSGRRRTEIQMFLRCFARQPRRARSRVTWKID